MGALERKAKKADATHRRKVLKQLKQLLADKAMELNERAALSNEPRERTTVWYHVLLPFRRRVFLYHLPFPPGHEPNWNEGCKRMALASNGRLVGFYESIAWGDLCMFRDDWALSTELAEALIKMITTPPKPARRKVASFKASHNN